MEVAIRKMHSFFHFLSFAKLCARVLLHIFRKTTHHIITTNIINVANATYCMCTAIFYSMLAFWYWTFRFLNSCQ